MLEIDEVEFGAIETEQLARGWPWLEADQAARQLAAVVALQRESGRRRFLVVATTETAAQLAAVIEALGVDRVLVVCLQAPAAVVAARLAEREPDRWPGKAGLIAHARVLAEQIPEIAGIDVILETEGRDADAVAVEVRRLLAERLTRWA
jgi:pimeloyl-ACP methyl ester carboxylesterase